MRRPIQAEAKETVGALSMMNCTSGVSTFEEVWIVQLSTYDVLVVDSKSVAKIARSFM